MTVRPGQPEPGGAEVTRFFDGLELAEPGVVQPPHWPPGRGTFIPGHDVTAWCGVARKP